MEKLKCYLIGSIQDDDKAGEWRNKLTVELEAMYFQVLDPCKMECNKTLADNIDEQKAVLRRLKRTGQFKRFHEVMSNIRQSDLTCVNASGFTIVCYDVTKIIGGTTHEIVECLSKQIPMYTAIDGGTKTDANDWTLDLLITGELANFGTYTEKIFPNFKQLLDCVALDYKDYINGYTDYLDQQKQLSITKQQIPERQIAED